MKQGIVIQGCVHQFKDIEEARKAIKKQYHSEIKPLTEFKK